MPKIEYIPKILRLEALNPCRKFWVWKHWMYGENFESGKPWRYVFNRFPDSKFLAYIEYAKNFRHGFNKFPDSKF